MRFAVELPVYRSLVFGGALVFLLAGTSGSVAQSSSRFSAFVAHVDEDGKASLTTQHGREMATGYSSSARGETAVLASHFLDVDADSEATVCAEASIPAAFEVSLLYPDPVIGDRIYFEDIIVEAYDENRNLIPGVPIIVSELSPDAMLLSSADWEFVEVATQGFASLLVHSYCDQLAEVAGGLSIIVEQ